MFYLLLSSNYLKIDDLEFYWLVNFAKGFIKCLTFGWWSYAYNLFCYIVTFTLMLKMFFHYYFFFSINVINQITSRIIFIRCNWILTNRNLFIFVFQIEFKYFRPEEEESAKVVEKKACLGKTPYSKRGVGKWRQEGGRFEWLQKERYWETATQLWK